MTSASQKPHSPRGVRRYARYWRLACISHPLTAAADTLVVARAAPSCRLDEVLATPVPSLSPPHAPRRRLDRLATNGYEKCRLALLLSLLGLSTLAPAQSIFHDGFELTPAEVIVAAAAQNATQGCYFVGDQQSDARGCALYRLSLSLSTASVTKVERLTDESLGGAWQPSAAGGELAFSRRTAEAIEVRVRPLAVTDVGDAGSLLSPTPGGWVWPHLASSGRVRVGRIEAEPPRCTVPSGPAAGSCVSVERWSETVETAGPGLSTAVAGDGSFSFEDTWAHPQDDAIVAGHGKFRWRGSGRPDCQTSCSDLSSSPLPIVLDTRSGRHQVLLMETTEPSVTDGTLALIGCAHVAWSPNGERLLCTEQGTPELDAAGLSSRIYVMTPDLAALAAGGSGNTTMAATPLFAHRTAADIFPLQPGERCDIFHHKYAEWCGDEQHVVATIGCGMRMDDGSTRLLYDRAYLIGLNNPAAPSYTDLTLQLERQTGQADLSMTSFTATCVRP